MRDQPRYEALESSDFFADRQIARQPVPGTVARGQLHDDDALYTGKLDGKPVAEFPVEIDRALLQRGQERFNIYCSMCHGYTGRGDGMIVQRGFKQPPSFHIERLHNVPPGHFFDVITNGIGFMPRHGPQIPTPDRWAIAAYIRVLQISQNATLDDVPEAQRRRLREEL